MEAIQAVVTRRSVRQYTEDPISEQDVTRLLTAAMHAPSAANQQPWHFVVIEHRDLLDRIPDFHPYCPFIRSAPLGIVVCGDLRREKFNGMFWVQDCSAATQNLLIAAHALGLGAVWLAVYPIEDRIEGLRELLRLPPQLIPLNVVAVGRPAKTPAPAERFDPARVTRNGF